MKQVSDRMMEISNLFKRLYEISINNSEKNSFCKCYSDLTLLFKEYSNKDFHQMKIILQQIKNYFKFIILQYTLSLKDLYNSFEYEQDLYIKVSENLKKRNTL